MVLREELGDVVEEEGGWGGRIRGWGVGEDFEGLFVEDLFMDFCEVAELLDGFGQIIVLGF